LHTCWLAVTVARPRASNRRTRYSELASSVWTPYPYMAALTFGYYLSALNSHCHSRTHTLR